ncbi:MAG: preprotein translocase subunit SecG [Rikenellaceae bacterium]|jgi:preprotein translocase subunit SecG|nr:preprotein translocase subunit SecG [Rikenellaceae bacterium]
MYIAFVSLILIASVLIVLAVLAQSPKSGMAANFGASNQVMGVRQTSDFLEKFTWILAVAIVVLSLAATMAMPSGKITQSKGAVEKSLEQPAQEPQNLQTPLVLPQGGEQPASEQPATEQPAQPAL